MLIFDHELLLDSAQEMKTFPFTSKNEHLIADFVKERVNLCAKLFTRIPGMAIFSVLQACLRGVHLRSDFEIWISAFISKSEKNRVQNQLDFLSSSN